MSMTRKHFNAIASQLQQIKEDVSPYAYGYLVRGMADICHECNVNFQRDRFYLACDFDPYEEGTGYPCKQKGQANERRSND